MTSTNKIYPFAQPAVPPNILNDADYSASTITTTTGYVEDTEADAPYMSKAQRQTSAIAAGVGQFIADNQTGTVDVTDNLSPATIAAMLEDAASNIAIGSVVTQPQFDNSTKASTTAFVQRALGNLASSSTYSSNTSLPNTDVGRIISPSTGSLAFQLPLASSVPNGAQLTFNGNTFGCVIARQGSDVINAGSAGTTVSLSLEANDTAVLTVIDGVWTLTGGELHQSFSSSFAASLIQPGWQQLPGGLILQWGFDTTVGNTATITFPIPFPNACFIVVANDGNPLLSTHGTAVTLATYDYTLTTFKKVGYVGSTISSSNTIWYAIGH